MDEAAAGAIITTKKVMVQEFSMILRDFDFEGYHYISEGPYGILCSATNKKDNKMYALKFFGYKEDVEPQTDFINNEILLFISMKDVKGAVQIEFVFHDTMEGCVSGIGTRPLIKVHKQSYPVIVMELLSPIFKYDESDKKFYYNDNVNFKSLIPANSVTKEPSSSSSSSSSSSGGGGNVPKEEGQVLKSSNADGCAAVSPISYNSSLSLSTSTSSLAYSDLSCNWTSLSSKPNELRLILISTFCRQVCLALINIHIHGYVHNDIKIQNILVRDNSLENIKISDVGSMLPIDPETIFASYPDNEKLNTNQGATTGKGNEDLKGDLCNCAPENICADERFYSIMSDIWQVGIILYSLLFDCNGLPQKFVALLTDLHTCSKKVESKESRKAKESLIRELRDACNKPDGALFPDQYENKLKEYDSYSPGTSDKILALLRGIFKYPDVNVRRQSQYRLTLHEIERDLFLLCYPKEAQTLRQSQSDRRNVIVRSNSGKHIYSEIGTDEGTLSANTDAQEGGGGVGGGVTKGSVVDSMISPRCGIDLDANNDLDILNILKNSLLQKSGRGGGGGGGERFLGISEKSVDELTAEIYKEIDLDGDGNITLTELKKYFIQKLLSPTSSDNKVEKVSICSVIEKKIEGIYSHLKSSSPSQKGHGQEQGGELYLDDEGGEEEGITFETLRSFFDLLLKE